MKAQIGHLSKLDRLYSKKLCFQLKKWQVLHQFLGWANIEPSTLVTIFFFFSTLLARHGIEAVCCLVVFDIYLWYLNIFYGKYGTVSVLLSHLLYY